MVRGGGGGTVGRCGRRVGAQDPLPKTSKMLARACDVRLPLMWDDEDFHTMADVIVESLDAALM